MLYYFFDYIEKNFDLPGAGLFQYISFRAGAAALLSLIITITFGKNLINYLRKKQVGEDIRDLGLEGQIQKKGTPTMGGLIIIAAILIPTLLMARLDNVYVILLIATTLWLGFIGFLDDYIKVFKKNKEGLAGRFKIVGQVTIGIIVATSTLIYAYSIITSINGAGIAIIAIQWSSYTKARCAGINRTCIVVVTINIDHAANCRVETNSIIAYIGSAGVIIVTINRSVNTLSARTGISCAGIAIVANEGIAGVATTAGYGSVFAHTVIA